MPADRQKITVYLKPNVGTFVDSGFSAFRRIDPGVIEYGWKLNVGFDYTRDGTRRCPAAAVIQDLCVAQTIGDYWRSGDEGRADNVLRVSDKIEMSPAQFLDHAPGSDKALINGGGIRHYSFEQLYMESKGKTGPSSFNSGNYFLAFLGALGTAGRSQLQFGRQQVSRLTSTSSPLVEHFSDVPVSGSRALVQTDGVPSDGPQNSVAVRSQQADLLQAHERNTVILKPHPHRSIYLSATSST